MYFDMFLGYFKFMKKDEKIVKSSMMLLLGKLQRISLIFQLLVTEFAYMSLIRLISTINIGD